MLADKDCVKQQCGVLYLDEVAVVGAVLGAAGEGLLVQPGHRGHRGGVGRRALVQALAQLPRTPRHLLRRRRGQRAARAQRRVRRVTFPARRHGGVRRVAPPPRLLPAAPQLTGAVEGVAGPEARGRGGGGGAVACLITTITLGVTTLLLRCSVLITVRRGPVLPLAGLLPRLAERVAAELRGVEHLAAVVRGLLLLARRAVTLDPSLALPLVNPATLHITVQYSTVQYSAVQYSEPCNITTSEIIP